jgi:uncharacterized phage protein (TIGR02218 family)
MRSASSALAAHVTRRFTTLARLWKVTREDGRIYGFTDHDEDIIYAGLRYRADLGISASNIQQGSNLSVDNLDVTGFLSSGTLTAVDVAGGVWDHADVRLMEINWADTSMGVLKAKRGRLGQITVADNGYTSEFRGLAASLNASIGEVTGPGCTAQLGDARCKVVLTDYTTPGTVTAAETDQRVFDTDLSAAIVRLTPDTTGAPDLAYFDDGVLTWNTGANTGLRMDVKHYTIDGRVELHLPMADPISPGDTFIIVAGCTKSRAGMCGPRFGNVINFRGFDFLPGLDATMKTPGQHQPTE